MDSAVGGRRCIGGQTSGNGIAYHVARSEIVRRLPPKVLDGEARFCNLQFCFEPASPEAIETISVAPASRAVFDSSDPPLCTFPNPWDKR
jgi:hypothetical protein